MGRHRIIPEQKDEYLGNMWGWKFSFFGLALLLLMLGILAYRAYYLPPMDMEAEAEKIEVEK